MIKIKLTFCTSFF